MINKKTKRKTQATPAHPQPELDEFLVELERPVLNPRPMSFGTPAPVRWTAMPGAGTAATLLRTNLPPGPADFPYPLRLIGREVGGRE